MSGKPSTWLFWVTLNLTSGNKQTGRDSKPSLIIIVVLILALAKLIKVWKKYQSNLIICQRDLLYNDMDNYLQKDNESVCAELFVLKHVNTANVLKS